MTRFVVAVAGAAMVVLMGGSVPAAAHASLVRTDPAAGATIATAPTEVSLTFTENVGSGYVTVTAPSGERVQTSSVRTVDGVLSAEVAPSRERGRYTVAYRVVSADGHPVSGEFTFTTTTGRDVKQRNAPTEEAFIHRHRGHLAIGLAAALLAIGLMLAPLRRGPDA